MKRCYFCGKKEDEEEIINVINGTEIVDSCDTCSRRENLPSVRKPDYSQLEESEKSYSVYDRLSRMAGLPQKAREKREEKGSGITLDKLRKPVDYNTRTLKRDSLITKKTIEVIDNFHWFIQTTRRRLKLSQKQLAEAINEEEEKIVIIEKGNLPDNAERILNKLEQFLKVKLLKRNSGIKQEIKVSSNPIVREEWSYSEVNEEPCFIREKSKKNKETSYILKVDREKIKDLTIADLQKMQKAKDILEKEKKAELKNNDEKIEERKFKHDLEKKAELNMNLKEIEDMIWRRSKMKKREEKKDENNEENNEDIEELLEEMDVQEEPKSKKNIFSKFKIRFKKKKKNLTKEEIDKIIEEQNKED